MLVYEGVKSGFINDVDLNLITDKILKDLKKYFIEVLVNLKLILGVNLCLECVVF